MGYEERRQQSQRYAIHKRLARGSDAALLDDGVVRDLEMLNGEVAGTLALGSGPVLRRAAVDAALLSAGSCPLRVEHGNGEVRLILPGAIRLVMSFDEANRLGAALMSIDREMEQEEPTLPTAPID